MIGGLKSRLRDKEPRKVCHAKVPIATVGKHDQTEINSAVAEREINNSTDVRDRKPDVRANCFTLLVPSSSSRKVGRCRFSNMNQEVDFDGDSIARTESM